MTGTKPTNPNDPAGLGGKWSADPAGLGGKWAGGESADQPSLWAKINAFLNERQPSSEATTGGFAGNMAKGAATAVRDLPAGIGQMGTAIMKNLVGIPDQEAGQAILDQGKALLWDAPKALLTGETNPTVHETPFESLIMPLLIAKMAGGAPKAAAAVKSFPKSAGEAYIKPLPPVPVESMLHGGAAAIPTEIGMPPVESMTHGGFRGIPEPSPPPTFSRALSMERSSAESIPSSMAELTRDIHSKIADSRKAIEQAGMTSPEELWAFFYPGLNEPVPIPKPPVFAPGVSVETQARLTPAPMPPPAIKSVKTSRGAVSGEKTLSYNVDNEGTLHLLKNGKRMKKADWPGHPPLTVSEVEEVSWAQSVLKKRGDYDRGEIAKAQRVVTNSTNKMNEWLEKHNGE